ncbi:MAG: MBL fold metallo-hydrolase [Spirochaetaceae bacterium]
MIDIIITGELGVNTYLYNFKEDKVVIIDPGADASKIIKKIESNRQTPKAIILTHGHFDHIGAVEQLKGKYSIPVYIHHADGTYLGKEGGNRHKLMFSSMGPNADYYFNNYYTECGEPDFLFDNNDILSDFELLVIHTPGHSPGSSCFYSKKNGVIFTGDTLFNGGLGRTDFTGGDYNTLIKSLKSLFKLPNNTVAYPGHGEITTIGAEKS